MAAYCAEQISVVAL